MGKAIVEKNIKQWDQFLEQIKKFIVENFEPGEFMVQVYNNNINNTHITTNSKFDELLENEKIANVNHKFNTSTLQSALDYLWTNNFINVIENVTKHGPDTTVKKYYSGFKLYVDNSQKNTLFFAREFNNSKTKNFYEKLKKKIEEKLNLDVVMLEDDKASGNIHSRIKNEIRVCKYFIADLTYKKTANLINGNVMFEIGMAKAYNKPVLLIMNSEVYPFNNKDFNVAQLPFDISSHTTIKYEDEDEEATNSIVDTIKSELI